MVVVDEFGALLDDGHLDRARSEVCCGRALGGSYELFAEPGRLSSGIHGEKAEIGRAVLLSGDLDTADDVGSVESYEDLLIGIVDDPGQRFGIGALAVE